MIAFQYEMVNESQTNKNSKILIDYKLLLCKFSRLLHRDYNTNSLNLSVFLIYLFIYILFCKNNH